MQQSRFLIISAVILALVFEISAHSQMRCAKYDPASGQCFAPIRNSVESFLQEAYSWSSGMPVCQSPMGKLITDAYSNGPACADYAGCPDPIGVYRPGETFTIMWFARNHAVDNQSPGTVSLYLSPVEANNQGADVSQATFSAGKFCSGPYMNCGGVNQDKTPCTLTCTMPSNLSSGYYTMWWKWDWQGGAKYSTCADINVLATSGSTTGPATPSTTGPSTSASQPVVPSTTAPVTPPTPATTAPVRPSTTAPVQPSTTGVPKPSTTGVPKPSTTGVPKPSTTAPVTPPAPVTTAPAVPSSSSGSNDNSASTCANVPLMSSSSTATILSVDTWGAGSSAMFRAVIKVQAVESVLKNWLVQFKFPTNAGSAKINSVVNAGSKLCESSTPFLHDMIQPASWAKQIASGEYVTIEVLGTNPNGLANTYIQSYSTVTVFRTA